MAETTRVRMSTDERREQLLSAGVELLRKRPHEEVSTEDIAEAVAWVLGLPAHVNVNRLEMMPTCQAAGPLMIKRAS